MDQQTWLTSTDPQRMLKLVTGKAYTASSDATRFQRYRATDRQLRLFACACVRQAWSQLTDERSRQAVEVAERYADGKATNKEDIKASEDTEFLVVANHVSRVAPSPMMAAYNCVGWGGNVPALLYWVRRWLEGAVPNTIQAALLREIIGNPYRPVTIDPAWLAWNDGTIPALAQASYGERVRNRCDGCDGDGDHVTGFNYHECQRCHGTGTIETGELDAGRLQVLADALEEAGCQDEAILRHLRGYELCSNCLGAGLVNLGLTDALCDQCLHTSERVDSFGEKYIAGCGFIRSRGPHVRGCWCLSLLLGKD